MQKTAAILLLTLFLFNLTGYKCWYYYLQQKENAAFEASLDKEEYDEKDLISFRIPLSNPYQVSWKEFERADGEVNIHGIIYKYVKRKVEDGQLILCCLPNYKKMQLAGAATGFGGHHNAPLTHKNLSADEFENGSPAALVFIPYTVTRYIFFLPIPLHHSFIGMPGKPPELA